MEAPADFAARGPHAVGVRTSTIHDCEDPARELTTDLWYPTSPAAGLAESAEHPFGQLHAAAVDADPIELSSPLVVFSHGNAGMRRQSTFLTTHLASWGICVVAPDHAGNTFQDMAQLRNEDERIATHVASRKQRPHDAVSAIDAAVAGAFGPIPLDEPRIGALGHSFGGWTATKLPRIDERISAVCALAPASEPFVGKRAYEADELPFKQPIPTLVIPGIDDVLVDLDTSIRPLTARLGTPTAVIGLERADHFHFCDGVELLHSQHAANQRPNQLRAARPYSLSLAQDRTHRALCGLVTWFFIHAFAGDGDAVTRLDAARLAALEPALRPL